MSPPPPSPPEVIIGIDLGTTNSLVAHCTEAGPYIILSPAGESHLPSIVHIDPTTHAITVGQSARAHAVERPTETIFSIKRLMGRSPADIAPELPYLPYAVVPFSPAPPAPATGHPAPSPTGHPAPPSIAAVQIGTRQYTPQQISAFILAELKRWAEAHFGHEVKKAVVTVPAYFDDAQRQATRDAGAIAGLDVVRIVNEPTAAALAYGLDKATDSKPSTIAVYDLGGGTFDISILRIESGVFRVLSTNGDTHLGGDDFDREIINLVQSEITTQMQAGDEGSGDRSQGSANASPPTNAPPTNAAPATSPAPLSAHPALSTSSAPSTQHSALFPPSTKQALRNFAEAIKIRLSEQPTASIEIALGGDDTQTYRRTITKDEFLSLIRPHLARSLRACQQALRDAGSPQVDRVVMVGGSTYIPLVREEVAKTFSAEAYTALNPMQVVALGAAVQGAILAKVNRDLLLQDIIPLSLGIETMGGAFSKLIVKGRTVPCFAEEIFSTYVEGQTNVKIHVLQGERELAKDCRSLANFTLAGLPPMPQGLPKIKVRFLVDANGVLSVSATEERSNTKAQIQVLPTHGLTRTEVQQMVRDSVAHAKEDMTAHRLIDLANQITLDTAAIQKSLAIMGHDLDPTYRQQIETALSHLHQTAQTNDAEAIHQALTALDKLSTPLAEMAVTKTLRSL